MLNSQVTDHLKQAGIFFLMILAGPFLMGFVSSWTAGFGFLLFILGAPLLIGGVAIGGIIYSVRGVKLARQPFLAKQRLTDALAAPVMLLATILLAWPSLAAGSFSGTWTRLMVNRDHYETIIAKARRGERSSSASSAFEEVGGVEYIVDSGPPVRVAFNPEGMLDNWSGIIFDPSGDVMRADGFDARTGKFLAPNEVTKLFGGDLVRCRRLWGDYYDCSFT